MPFSSQLLLPPHVVIITRTTKSAEQKLGLTVVARTALRCNGESMEKWPCWCKDTDSRKPSWPFPYFCQRNSSDRSTCASCQRNWLEARDIWGTWHEKSFKGGVCDSLRAPGSLWHLDELAVFKGTLKTSPRCFFFAQSQNLRVAAAWIKMQLQLF